MSRGAQPGRILGRPGTQQTPRSGRSSFNSFPMELCNIESEWALFYNSMKEVLDAYCSTKHWCLSAQSSVNWQVWVYNSEVTVLSLKEVVCLLQIEYQLLPQVENSFRVFRVREKWSWRLTHRVIQRLETCWTGPLYIVRLHYSLQYFCITSEMTWNAPSHNCQLTI